MTEQDWTVWAAMVKTASRRETTNYGSLAGLIGLSNPRELTPYLNRIAAYETSKRRPILSAVVVSRSDRPPSDGFYEYAQSIHAFAGGDREGFWKDELERVYTYWEP